MTYSQLSDADLVALLRQSNQAAFAALVHRHTNSMLSLATRTLHSKADAEDVVQTVLLNLWCKPNTWDQSKSQLSTWLYSVVLNCCRDLLRKQTSLANRLMRVINSENLSTQSTPSEQVRYEGAQEAQHRDDLLAKSIKTLPPRQRDAINLAIFCELPQKEVAQIMGVGVKAVESLLVRAKTNLAKSISAHQSSHAQLVSGAVQK